MKNLLFLTSIALLVLGCKSKVKPEETTQKPNVLIILTDQHTNDGIGYLGNPNLHTPAMDALAKGGVYFTESYCTSPVCGPGRSSLITGRMPHETGVVWNSTHINPAYPTIGQIFQQEGYNTAWAGKWHLPEGYPARSKMDSVRGFKVLPFQSLEESWDTGEATDGPIAEATVNYLNNYQDEKPFLLAVSLHNPHDICYIPRRPEQYAKASEIDTLPPLPPNFEIAEDEPQFLQEKRLLDHYGDELLMASDYSEDDWRAYLYHYYRFTEMVDREIGKILEAVRANGLEENTIIVLTSEHGDGAAAHHWAAKLSFYEEASTVPFIIRWKGHIPEGVINRNQLVSGIDVTPTLCDYAGIKNPPAFTGKSLRPILENPYAQLREYLVVELADDKEDSTRHARMIRNLRYKYNLYNQGERNEQLFDLWKDPGETQNLAEEPTYEPVKTELKKALDNWMEETNDDFHTWKN